MKNKIIVITGPTALGKSALAVKLAKRINGEIISADSMQAYKGMGILSQSPTGVQKGRVPHYLVNFLNPKEEYSAAAFSSLAGQKIKSIIKKGKVPIVVGGSGLYLKALIHGLFPSGGKDEALRANLWGAAHGKGSLFLHEKLKNIDPAAADRIHPNDTKKVIRAIEICMTEKRTKTSLKKETRGLMDIYDVKIFGLIAEREKLYEKINKRVDVIFGKGAVREAGRLLRRKLSITSGGALGLKQLKGYLDKMYSLDTAKDMLKRDTRRFAKRQLTWFRKDRRIVWLDVDKMGEDKAIRRILSGFGDHKE